MKTLFPQSTLYQNTDINVLFVNDPLATRYVNNPSVLNWKIPYIAITPSGATIQTEDGVDILTEDGQTILTE